MRATRVRWGDRTGLVQMIALSPQTGQWVALVLDDAGTYHSVPASALRAEAARCAVCMIRLDLPDAVARVDEVVQ